jgi:hypothetical protein
MLVTDTAAPMEMATELMLQSAPEVPTVPSKTEVVPSLFTALNQAAVPEAFAEASCVIAAKVATPAEVEPESAVAPKVSSARSVCVVTAVSDVAGCAPS